ncbi:MAG: hypothetical protein KIT56_07210, partial [Gammaproteobacteria bacterium]|nr:hypothetical protein [Gammaproteobacteria bacterium]MCW5583652.1 hypothetical protein [Gammaproteobacteria bacterium]
LEQRIADQQRYEQQLKQLEQTIQQMNQELMKIQHEKSLLQHENQKSTFENESLKSQLGKLNEKHELINSRFSDTFNELAKKTQDQQHWQDQFNILQIKNDEQNKLFVELKTHYATLLQQSETMKIEVKELREQNKLLAHEKWELGQEKAHLEGQLKYLQSTI